MIDLDDPRALERADPSGMLRAVLGLPDQCLEGYRGGRDTDNLPSGESLSALVVCGMGGSGVAGDVLSALYRRRLGIPIVVVKSPALPGFCGKDTLVVCSSYSGSTAETLACFEEAAVRGCRMVAVTSGGDLARRAREEDCPIVTVPEGLVAPRAAMGYLTFGLLGALEGMGVLPVLSEDVERSALAGRRLAARLGPGDPVAHNPAKSTALAVGDRYPVIWGADGLGAVAATRWKPELWP